MGWFVWRNFGFVLCLPLLRGCEFGWKDYEGLCYTIIHYPYPPGGAIIDARSECRKRGADLISVKTEEYQLFIEDLFMDENGTTSVHRDVYMAAGDALTEGYFQWFDGSPVTHSKWRTSKGEPDNQGPGGIPENCVRIKSGYKKSTGEVIESRKGLWITVPCLAPAGRIDSVLCQKPDGLGKDRKRIFIRLKQTYLDSHQIATYSGLTSYRCIFHCLNDYRCLSINWNVHRSLDNCQLNNATRWEDNEVLITHQTEQIDPALWYYYETSYPAYGN